MEDKRNYHEPCTCNQPGPAPCPIHENKPCTGEKGNCFCLPPKAVPVEVDGCPILFRKVEIPASVGDEETDPPVPGRYRNVLLTYEAGGHAYMYSSDGIPTQLPEKGEKGDTGEQGPQGPVGPAGPQGPQGETGPQGVQGEQGPQGPKGEDGAGIEIAGTVATYADLPTNLTPEDEGKGYYVEADGKLYIWNGTAFPADGDGVQIQGPQGPQGIQGVQGPQGEQGTQGPAGANGADGFSPVATVTQTATGATITITDAQGTTTANIRNGEDGNVPIATTTVPGKVMPDGTTITVDANGVISSAAGYVLPPATTSTLGGVIVGNNLTVGANGMLDATDTTYSVMTGATSGAAGTSGLVPAPAAGDNTKFLGGDGAWKTIPIGTTFYYNSNSSGGIYEDQVVLFYKDSSLTQPANNVDIYNAFEYGRVLFVDAYDGDGYGPMEVFASDYYARFFTFNSVNPSERIDFWYDDVNRFIVHTVTYQESLTAGSNITISDNTISATNTTYTAGTNIQISAGNVISATDTTYSAFGGATSSVAGSAGLVPAPTTSDPDKYLKGDGTWANLPSANNISSTDWNALWQ